MGLPAAGLLLGPTLLCIREQPRSSDAIILLGGEDGSRVAGVIDLYTNGLAPLVIVSGDIEARRLSLVAGGIPEVAILMENESTSTAENARFTVRILRERQLQSALIVTSWYHTRRARNCFEHFAPDLKFYVVPTYQTPEVARSWGSPVPQILKEYPKLLWYWPRHGIAPWGRGPETGD